MWWWLWPRQEQLGQILAKDQRTKFPLGMNVPFPVIRQPWAGGQSMLWESEPVLWSLWSIANMVLRTPNLSFFSGIPCKALKAGWRGCLTRLPGMASAAQESSCPASQGTAQPHTLVWQDRHCCSHCSEQAGTVGAQGKATHRFLKGPSSASRFKSLFSLDNPPVSVAGIWMLLKHTAVLSWIYNALGSQQCLPTQCVSLWLSQAVPELRSCPCLGMKINLRTKTQHAHLNPSQAKE